MSLISEALKKVQQERDGMRGGEGDGLYGERGHSPRPLWKSPLVFVAVLALILGLLGVWLTSPAKVPDLSSSVPLVVTESEAPEQPASVDLSEESLARAELPQALPQPPLKQEQNDTAPVVKPKPAAVAAEVVEMPSGSVVSPARALDAQSRVKAEAGQPKVSPEQELAITLRTAESAEDFVRLYQMLKQRGEDAQAFDMVKRGLLDFPKHGVLNQLALIGYVRVREYAQGLLHAEPALKAEPDRPSLLTYRGLCHFHLRDYPRALADFGRSLSLDPQATENIYYLALIYDSQGQYDLAIRYYQMFLDRHPSGRSFRHKDYIVDRLGQLTRKESE